ncbi:hypothetical protein K439DRAFT_1418054, partial [Ramaria rubella]
MSFSPSLGAPFLNQISCFRLSMYVGESYPGALDVWMYVAPISMSNPQTLHGNCLCRNVTYTIENPQYEGAAVCHCDDCRRGCGSAYSIVITVPRSTVTIKGNYKEYLTKGTSGQLAHRIFCPNCGSQIANFPDANKEVAFIKAGTLSDDAQKSLKPTVEESCLYTICIGWKVTNICTGLHAQSLALRARPIRAAIRGRGLNKGT